MKKQESQHTTMVGTNSSNYSRRRHRKPVQHYTDSNPSTFTTKKKKGEQASHEEESESLAASSSATTPRGGRRRRKRPLSFAASSTSPEQAAVPPDSPEPQVDHVLPHAVSVAPMFPMLDNDKSSSQSLLQRLKQNPSTSLAFGRGLGTPRQAPKPKWTSIPVQDVYHPLDYDSEKTLKPDASLVSRAVTCSTASDHHLLLGDTAGFVSVYSLDAPMPLPISLLSTSASTREFVELCKISKNKKTTTKYGIRVPDLKSYKTIASQHPNAIVSLCLCGTKVCLSTKSEVEMIDVVQNTIVWTHTLMHEDGPATRMDLHPNDFGSSCLASFCHGATSALNPLVLLKTTNEKSVESMQVVPLDAKEKKPIKLGPKCAAMWDKSNEKRFLMVTLLYDDTTNDSVAVPSQELLLVDLQTMVIQQRAPIPLRVNGTKTVSTQALSQSPRGNYTLVASTRGLRLFETSSLSLLRVYGETISLHGHSVVWQDCFFIAQQQQNNMTIREDELVYRDEKKQSMNQEEDENLQNVLVVGVPNAFRQPVEYKNTLHMWDAPSDGKHTAFLLAGPTPDGITCVLYRNERLLLTTQQGQCVQMVSTLKSEWPGIMYPPGYQVISDNLVYVEDEDEVDAVVVDHVVLQEQQVEEEEEEVVDEELALALRKSVEEQQRLEELNATIVQVVDDDDQAEEALLHLPCHPEPYLKQRLQSETSKVAATASGGMNAASAQQPQHDVFPQDYLSLLPQVDRALETERCFIDRKKPTAAAAAATRPVGGSRNKRGRTANLEALMKASLVPQLQSYMMARQAWSKGRGSNLQIKRDELEIKKNGEEETSDNVIEQGERRNGATTTAAAASSGGTMEASLPRVDANVPRETDACTRERGAEPAMPVETTATARESDPVVSTTFAASGGVSVAMSVIRGTESAAASGGEPVKATETSATGEVVAPAAASITAALATANGPAVAGSVEETKEEAATLSSQVSMDETSSLAAQKVSGVENSNAPSNTKETEADSTAMQKDTASPAVENDAKNVAQKPNAIADDSNTVELDSNVCDACLGRMVLHKCGKRELPVDFEAIARAQKEKEEREKAEKIRIRTEKRRRADQKRREAKRQKKLEEEKQRKREEAERKRIEREEAKQILEVQEERRQEDHQVKEKRRAEMMQRLIEAQSEQAQEVRPSVVETARNERMERANPFYSESAQPADTWLSSSLAPVAPMYNQARDTTSYGEARAASPYNQVNAAPSYGGAPVASSYSQAPAAPSYNHASAAPSYSQAPPPAATSQQPSDKRTEALEALATLANGFVGGSAPSQQSSQMMPSAGRASPHATAASATSSNYHAAPPQPQYEYHEPATAASYPPRHSPPPPQHPQRHSPPPPPHQQHPHRYSPPPPHQQQPHRFSPPHQQQPHRYSPPPPPQHHASQGYYSHYPYGVGGGMHQPYAGNPEQGGGYRYASGTPQQDPSSAPASSLTESDEKLESFRMKFRQGLQSMSGYNNGGPWQQGQGTTSSSSSHNGSGYAQQNEPNRNLPESK